LPGKEAAIDSLILAPFLLPKLPFLLREEKEAKET
jgi:hypothetical protein